MSCRWTEAWSETSLNDLFTQVLDLRSQPSILRLRERKLLPQNVAVLIRVMIVLLQATNLIIQIIYIGNLPITVLLLG